MLHRHRFVEVERHYTPQAGKSIEGVDSDTFRKALFGFTTIEASCACGQTRFVEVVGDVREGSA